MSDPTIAAWSRESDLLFALRQLREENELLKTQREWQGLTDEEISGCINATASLDKGQFLVEFSKAIEAKLKEKN